MQPWSLWLRQSKAKSLFAVMNRPQAACGQGYTAHTNYKIPAPGFGIWIIHIRETIMSVFHNISIRT
ncbi:MAG: hypothetical protein JAY66_00685, partial [Candidatus Thiodiazotropha taylori]|nr:hypothetical protein [Candidatus Thiodiazotropha taylori]